MSAPLIHLRLNRAADLFTVPEFDWQQSERNPLSGVTQAFISLEQSKSKSLALILEIAAEPLSLSAQGQLRTVFVAYCEQQAGMKTFLADDIRRQGWRSLRLGLLALAVALGLSSVVSHVAPFPRLLNGLLSEGFVIVGWVVLWHPLEALLYEGRPQRRLARLYQRLARCEIRFPLPISPP